LPIAVVAQAAGIADGAYEALPGPLTALQLKTQTLQRRTQRGADARDAAQIDDIALQVQRFGAIVSHVLEALSIRAEGVQLVLQPCDLATMVPDRVRRVAERTESPITVDSPLSVVGNWDRARLETVVDVLLDKPAPSYRSATEASAFRPIDGRRYSKPSSARFPRSTSAASVLGCTSPGRSSTRTAGPST
jgi:hypothetical protein